MSYGRDKRDPPAYSAGRDKPFILIFVSIVNIEKASAPLRAEAFQKGKMPEVENYISTERRRERFLMRARADFLRAFTQGFSK